MGSRMTCVTQYFYPIVSHVIVITNMPKIQIQIQYPYSNNKCSYKYTTQTPQKPTKSIRNSCVTIASSYCSGLGGPRKNIGLDNK